ncbi:tetratricopeptide repeat protein [Mesorhizobium sp. BR1-1-16]|uniref:tetratricopeptide repeat protein n=1 Tax=Mesorhizobium sp. BR1-1-16 TaxID=2876653 RepID=UPI001CCBF7BF|nr:tetratricopeptide repeat protein [Mesorhizobium sp. BR1-1-16]MBZ9935106.1 tetratricopeptide repeat protein [Mesorhizobium sp. BR1-1-16]
MTDIFHEVEEDLRREQAKRLWRRFGPYVLIVAVLIVVGTAGWRGWLYWREQQAAATGDRFVAALQLAEDGKKDEALKALQDLSQTGTGGYPVLAQFRAAAEMAGTGKTDDAVKAFDTIASNGSTPPLLKAMARLRAAMLLVDTVDLAGMKTRLDDLAATGGPWRNSARELLGLTAWRVGDLEAARGYFTEISDDPTAPQSTKARANLMLELIRSKVGDVKAPAKT